MENKTVGEINKLNYGNRIIEVRMISMTKLLFLLSPFISLSLSLYLESLLDSKKTMTHVPKKLFGKQVKQINSTQDWISILFNRIIEISLNLHAYGSYHIEFSSHFICMQSKFCVMDYLVSQLLGRCICSFASNPFNHRFSGILQLFSNYIFSLSEMFIFMRPTWAIWLK